MNKILFFTAALLFSVIAKAQDLPLTDQSAPIELKDSVPLDKFTAGIGVGFDFGGIGANLMYYPQRNIGVFFGAGYPLTGFGYNAGIKIRYAENDNALPFTPFIIGMYGYNTTVRYDHNPKYDKLFYNFSVGGGVDFRPANSKLGYFTATVLVPFRNPDGKDYVNNYVDWFYGITPSNKQYPLSFSFGYKFIIK